MNEMVAIRDTGNQNIIVVPVAEQGQDESVLLNKGTGFLKNKTNILYDIHAYEKWLLDSETNINNRLELLKQKNLPIFFGETAPLNAGILMNQNPFLDVILFVGFLFVLGFGKMTKMILMHYLLAGLPNDKNNNNWGSTFKNLSTKTRNP
jgi:mannan endo-1,4-beta-mannosidase